MTYSQKNRLDRIQHTILSNTEKKLHRKRAKNDEIRLFFGPTILMLQPNIFRLWLRKEKDYYSKRMNF
jgi:hypothetical protein